MKKTNNLKIIKYIFISIGIVLLLGVLLTTLASILPSSLGSKLVTIHIVISPLIGGGVAGFLIKKRGLIYGALVGSLIQGISLLHLAFMWNTITLGTLESELLKQNVQNHSTFPIYILLTALGGWLGEKYSKIKKAKLISS